MYDFPHILSFLRNVTLLHFLHIKLNLSLTFVPPGCQKTLIRASDLSCGQRENWEAYALLVKWGDAFDFQPNVAAFITI